MKWKCTYLPEEESTVRADLEELRRRHPEAVVRKSTAHPPKQQIYITTVKTGQK